jgi:type IV secretion system protein VirB10
MSEQPENQDIPGERGIPDVSRNQTLQSKMNNFLALAIILLVGGGFLYFYYSNINAKQHQVEAEKKKQHDQQMQGDSALPKLGAVPFPSFGGQPTPTTTETATVGDIFGPPPAIPEPVPFNTMNNAPPPKPEKTPEELAQDRRLNSPVFTKTGGTATATATAQNPGDGAPTANTPQAPGAQGNSALGNALKPTTTVAARAEKLPTMTYLIPKGAKGDCTLETAISSQLPGLVTCVLAYDIYGANGKVVMLERGTTLTGETRSQVQQGQNRMFVLWSEARTPTGVTAQLDSPATDALGRSGVTGELDTHFWDRFGAAILISVVNAAAQGAANYAGSSDGGSNINLNPQGSSQVMTGILQNTINIPPTITVAQGERLQILFARNVDFRPVYALADKYQVLQ